MAGERVDWNHMWIGTYLLTRFCVCGVELSSLGEGGGGNHFLVAESSSASV